MCFKHKTMISKKIGLIFILLITTFTSFSQEKFTLSGTITDFKNNETLIGVNVYIPVLKIGTTTNEYGFYSLTVPKANMKSRLVTLAIKPFKKQLL